MKFLRVIQRIADKLEGILKVAVTMSLATIAVVVNVAVFFRYVINAPLSWTYELSQYLLIFTVLFAASIALRHEMFVKIELVENILPTNLRRVAGITAHIFVGFLLLFCIAAPKNMIKQALLTHTISPAMKLPMTLVYRVLQLGFATMFIFLLFGIVDKIVQKHINSTREDIS